ncbi:MAG: hypothetical protein LBC96_00615 [Lachnospiraceae bacterium]|jgi:hypothetical protein|nr:hypothetical protein [Lachnospiraceae bacterium]
MQRKTKVKTAIVLYIFCFLMLSITIFAESREPLTIDIDGIIIDVDQLAKDNDVDPHELYESIKSGIGADRTSPFADLATLTPNADSFEASRTQIPIETIDSWGNAITKMKIQITLYNQDTTAHVVSEDSSMASGKTPMTGMCKMNKNVTTKTRDDDFFQIKLGTTIIIPDSTEHINIHEKNYPAFKVDDRSIAVSRSPMWLDIHFGINSASNHSAAITHGVKKVTYYYHYY